VELIVDGHVPAVALVDNLAELIDKSRAEIVPVVFLSLLLALVDDTMSEGRDNRPERRRPCRLLALAASDNGSLTHRPVFVVWLQEPWYSCLSIS
jgi:hypothetical protein